MKVAEIHFARRNNCVPTRQEILRCFAAGSGRRSTLSASEHAGVLGGERNLKVSVLCLKKVCFRSAMI